MKIHISHLARPLFLARADEPRAVSIWRGESLLLPSNGPPAAIGTIPCYKEVLAHSITQFGLLVAIDDKTQLYSGFP
jgi:hypothetical protein